MCDKFIVPVQPNDYPFGSSSEFFFDSTKNLFCIKYKSVKSKTQADFLVNSDFKINCSYNEIISISLLLRRMLSVRFHSSQKFTARASSCPKSDQKKPPPIVLLIKLVVQLILRFRVRKEKIKAIPTEE